MVDASQVGLGAVLLQDGKPVAYTLKALTPAEMRYANIDREMLVVVFGCLKYHHYLYGRRFVCRSDHQPLEKIHLKNLSDVPPRLQRLLLKIQPYDFEIKYIPGKEVALADALSRVNPQDKMELKGLDFTIHELTPCMTPIQVSRIHEEQKKDATLQLLTQQLITGWPNHCKEVDPALTKYWALRDDISIEDGCIAYLGRLVIPPILRKSCMESLHRGHPGMSKMHLRAKQSLYWPGINEEIRSKVENCIPCQTIARSQQKEPAIPIEVPFRPWQKIGMDLFFCKGKWYLLVCEYYSKFPVFRLLLSISSKNVISALESIISEYGNVEEIICDNGKQFMAQEYKNFAVQYGFKLTTSSPYHPKGHGFIERQVQTIKKILIKCELDGTSPHMAMLELRATPLDDSTPSPAELLGNRRYKTTLPAITRASYNSEAVWQSLLKRKEYAGHDAHAKELPQLLPQQPVWLQKVPNISHWQPATVISTPGESTPSSYVVSTQDGARYWHNRLMLQQSYT